MPKPRNPYGLEMSSGAAAALYRIATIVGKIEAIAMVRWRTGMGLIESKEWVERFMKRYEEMMEVR